MNPIHILILFLHLALCNSHVCENDVQRDGIDVADAHRWKRINESANLLHVNITENPDGKARRRNWSDPGFASGGMGVLSRGIKFLSPAFTLSPEAITDERCKIEYDTYLRELSELKLWAVKMYDSSGKLASGFLNGNVNQFGDFDQCLGAESPAGNIRGKYCLAYFQIKLNERSGEEIREILDLVHSHNPFTSEMSDPGHRIPRFSTINWAVCVPSACSHEEVERQLKRIVRRNSENLSFDVEVMVEEEMCHVKKPFKLSKSFVIVGTFLICVIATVLLSTAKDVMSDAADTGLSFWMNFLHCFSLKRNLKQLTRTARAPDDVGSIHGIRTLNALMLLLSHKSMALFYFPYVNRTYLVENASRQWTIVARIASLYTDSFIMISGILAAYSFSKSLKNKGSLDIKNEYVNRLLRIFPLLIFTVLVSTFILPELGSGPQWGLTVSHHSNVCKSSWWKNLLFVHNYFGFENMCLTHTHHLGIDTQLFLLSPFLVYILHKWQLAGACFLVSIAAVSTGFRYRLTLDKNLSYFIYPGISVRQMIDTANYSYIIPSHRITVYIIGIIIGYILRVGGREFQMKPHIRRIWWMIALSMLYYVVSKAMTMNQVGQAYNKHDAANYSALAPIAWCLVLGWIIFASHTNSGGALERALSSKLFVIWTKISYAVYLIQFPVFFFNVGRQRYPQEYTIFTLINMWEYSSVIAASVIVTLFVDMPSNNIRQLLRRRFSASHGKTVKNEEERS